MIIQDHKCNFRKGMTWWTFNYLEERLTSLSRYVAFSEKNKRTWSEEIASLLILSGSAMDTFFRSMKECPYLQTCQSIIDMDQRVEKRKKEEKGPDFWTVKEYRDGFNPIYELSENILIAPFGLDKMTGIQPFKEFSAGQVPEWWTAYNNLKHDYYDKIQESANLNNLIYCMGGLLILNTLHLCSREYLCIRGMIRDKYGKNSSFLCPDILDSFKGVPKRWGGYDFSIVTKQFVFNLRAIN